MHLVSIHGPEHIVQPANRDDVQTGDENEVDEELCYLFPFSLQYLDLSSLKHQFSTSRLPLPLLIREEYNSLCRSSEALPEAGVSSAIISGQLGVDGPLSSYAVSRPLSTSLTVGRDHLVPELIRALKTCHTGVPARRWEPDVR